MSKAKLDASLEAWIVARKRHGLSHAHVQMARELGMNPKKLGGKDNHKAEPWKLPLPDFIQELYEKRFGRERPTKVLSIEEIVADTAMNQGRAEIRPGTNDAGIRSGRSGRRNDPDCGVGECFDPAAGSKVREL